MDCAKGFGLKTRRHHCRKCGRVLCKACLPHERYISKYGTGGFDDKGGAVAKSVDKDGRYTKVPICRGCEAVRPRPSVPTPACRAQPGVPC